MLTITLGQTALYIAARAGNLPFVKKLLEVPSLDIDMRMKSDGATALHGEELFWISTNLILGAALSKSPFVVALLLINGANDQLRDNKFTLAQSEAVG